MSAPGGPGPADSARWTLRLLGGFELASASQRHTKLGTRAAMALLARLCLRPGSAHPRETLVDLLWPHVAADAGRQRLRQTLSTLKQVLEPASEPGLLVIEADRLSLRLVPGSIWCDALAFEAAYKSGDHDAAHALYTGELLPGFFDEWIGDERLRLEGLFDRLRPAAPPPVATTAPPPLPQTAAAAGPQRAPLPSYLTRLIGADPQATQLQQQVAEHRLVTLMGPGGTGKTRMAVEVAHSLAAAGGDGAFELVVFVPLAACRNRQALLDQLLLSLHVAQGKAGALDTAVQALEGRRVLLVLDNFEQVVDDGAEAVGELGMRLPLLHLLVTSRRALALAGEREITVDALALPSADAALAEAAANPAVSLFVDRARAARAEFHLHDGNRAAVIDLVQLLDGMPLAIELAAARVRSLAPAEMAATLRAAREGAGDGGSALALLARAPQRGRQDTRHHSMQDTIDWSWQLLPTHLRTLLAGLTVFQGGFTAAAAQAVCGGAADVALGLDELLSHSLLRSQGVPQSDALRFGLYEPIREFAQANRGAAAADSAAALRRRHRAWAAAWGAAMPATPPLAALRVELPNLSAAMASAVADGEPQAALQVALALQPALDHVSLPGAAQAALEAALAALAGTHDAADTRLRHAGMVLLGLLWFRSGHGQDALPLLDQALDAITADAPALRARALLYRILVGWGSGERGPQLLAWLDEAQALAQAAGDAALCARADGVHADLLGMLQRDFDQAGVLHARALAAWQAQGDALAALRSRFSAAQLDYMAGRHERACAQMALLADDARRLQSWHLTAQCLNVRGATLHALRRWPQAAQDGARSMQVAWQALDPWNTALALWTLLAPLSRAGPADVAQQLAGFVSQFWVQRFSPLHAGYTSALRRARRMAHVRIGAAASAEAFAAGRSLTAAQAVALALSAAGL